MNCGVPEAIIESDTHREFGQEAREAVRKWRFEPGERNGEKVKFKMRVPIPFNVR